MILKMDRVDQLRRWQQLGLCALLCVVFSALAKSQTSPPPANPAPTSAHSAAKKSNRHTAVHTASKHSSSHGTRSSRGKSSRGKKGSRKRGQQAIDSTRAREIQEALIREHYMQGEPSGTWDAATQAAMQRYQADQGWQSKQIPDSRALIKLGLGPSHDHLLNPESAMTMPSAPAATDPKPADPAPVDPKSADPKGATKQPPTDHNLPRP
jgi:Putative peptidoglycan binding domain